MVLKGHGFSRAATVQNCDAALAAEGTQLAEVTLPQGLKPGVFFFPTIGAAKAAPFQSRKRNEVFRTFSAIASLAALLFAAGCRQDMQDQPKLFSQRGSEMFADHRGARPQVVNTVARGQLREDSYFYTGVVQGADGYRQEQNLMPFPVTMEVLQRGQERFNIYCTPCHSRVGNGLGEIVERGYKPAANLHDQVRLSQPISHYFYVMSHGYGAMPDYSSQLTPVDRWAVAAYIRALQLSQAAKPEDVPAGVQVKSLKEVAAENHLPEGFAEPWTLPTSAVQAYPHDTRQGTPGMAPANPADPLIKIPATKPAPAPQK
jgi:mono/diheme cytochrome c family protein